MASEKAEVSQNEMISEVPIISEKQTSELVHVEGSEKRPLQLDKAGLPLVPQPTSRKDDPLVCTRECLHGSKIVLMFVIELVANAQTPCHATDLLARNARTNVFCRSEPSICSHGEDFQPQCCRSDIR